MWCGILHNIADQVLLLWIKPNVCAFVRMIILLAPFYAHHSLIYVFGISCRLTSSTTPSAFYQYLFSPTVIMISDDYQYGCHLSLFWFRVNKIESWCHFWTPHNFLHIELFTTYHVTSENKRKFLTNLGLPQPNVFSSTMPVWFY